MQSFHNPTSVARLLLSLTIEPFQPITSTCVTAEVEPCGAPPWKEVTTVYHTWHHFLCYFMVALLLHPHTQIHTHTHNLSTITEAVLRSQHWICNHCVNTLIILFTSSWAYVHMPTPTDTVTLKYIQIYKYVTFITVINFLFEQVFLTETQIKNDIYIPFIYICL